MTLKSTETKTFYDRFGTKQDAQGFYEDPALNDLIAHAHFEEAEHIFEFGCGTGRFVERLLKGYLPARAVYQGCDLSPTMVKLARERLSPYAERAQVSPSTGPVKFDLPNHSVDRVISTYVLDLLSETDIGDFFNEAFRVLEVGGKLCLVSLTNGTTGISRFVTMIWKRIFQLHATLVGGCRPIRLEQFIIPENWEIEYRGVVIAFGVPSEVVVARTKYTARTV